MASEASKNIFEIPYKITLSIFHWYAYVEKSAADPLQPSPPL